MREREEGRKERKRRKEEGEQGGRKKGEINKDRIKGVRKKKFRETQED